MSLAPLQPGPRSPAPDDPEELTLSFTAEMDLVEGVLTLAEQWAAERGVDKDGRVALRLVLEELLVNLCLHGQSPAANKALTAELTIAAVYAAPKDSGASSPYGSPYVKRLTVVLEDTGQEFNPLLHESVKANPLQQSAPGGYGLTLVRLLSVDFDYVRRPGRNVLSLALDFSGPGPSPASAVRPLEKNEAETGLGHGGPFRGLARCWYSGLAVRQAVFFFIISLAMLWGGVLFYSLAVRDFRQTNSVQRCLQALHIQNFSSSTFLGRLAASFEEFSQGLESRPNYAEILADDNAFFDELRDGVLWRAVTADTAVLGVLKGEKGRPGALLVSRTNDTVSRLFLDLDFDPLLKNEPGHQPVWVGPVLGLPQEAAQGHAGLVLGKIVSSEPEKWIGLVITMPWIAASLDTLSGFENVASVLVTADGRYVVYPPGRSAFSGPQGLAEEPGAKPWPQTAEFLKEPGVRPLTSLFPDGLSPWPLPWSGPTTLAHTPMSIPGWSLMLFVSSEEIGATPPPLPRSMVALAALAPLLITLMAWKISSRVLRPLGRLSEALHRLADGDLATPLPAATSHDEVSDMLKSFEQVRITLHHSLANLVEATAAESRLHNELALARAIQESMLPVSPPEGLGLKVATSLDMAGEVCGDLFDCFILPDNPDVLYCLIGDVCGKGMPASVIMSRAMVLARSILLSGQGPAETLARLNDALLRYNDSLMFVTLLVATLEAKTGRLTWASAGHPPPMLGRAGFAEKPGAAGHLPWSRDLVLGVKGGLTYTEHAIDLVPGQSILLYTDGADEAMGPGAAAEVPPQPGRSEGLAIFGAENLESVFLAACQGPENGPLPPPQGVLENVRASLISHMAGQPPFDDVSLIVIRWDGLQNRP